MVLKLARISLLSGYKKNFDYIIPAYLQPLVSIGSLVLVELRKIETYGFVDALFDLDENPEGTIKYKELKAVFDTSLFLDQQTIKEASWLSWYYYSAFSVVIKNFFPKAFFIKDSSEAEILSGKINEFNSPELRKVCSILPKNGTISLLKLKKILGIEEGDNLLSVLENNGVIKISRKITLESRKDKKGEPIFFPVQGANPETKISKKSCAYPLWHFI